MGVTGVPQGVGQRAILSVCQGIGKVESMVAKVLGQRPNGELGFCDFVVEFGVSVLKGNKTKQLSGGVSVSSDDTHVGSGGSYQEASGAEEQYCEEETREAVTKTKDHTGIC